MKGNECLTSETKTIWKMLNNVYVMKKGVKY